MRFLAKPTNPPPSIRAFLQAQVPLGINLDYDRGFGRKPELREELIAEQFGLCAYTGTGIDMERLTAHNVPEIRGEGVPATPLYQATIEHLKPRSVCKEELRAAGKEPGIDLGEDMDHRNMVAVLRVNGSSREKFGESARGNHAFPVWPTHVGCEACLRFHLDGNISGVDAAAEATIRVLKLDHPTLRDWRRAAIEAFLDPAVVTTREDLEFLAQRLDLPTDGRLEEFCFCVRNVAVSMLA